MSNPTMQQTTSKPTLNADILRLIAEAANGIRKDAVWFVVRVDGTTGKLDYEIKTSDPGQPADAVVIPCQTTLKQEDRPHMNEIKCKAKKKDGSMVDGDLLFAEVNGNKERCDAAFWSESAVEKFLIPYYASVAGDEAVAEIAQLLRDFHGAADIYALGHLPKSEYTPSRGSVLSKHIAVLTPLKENGNKLTFIPIDEYRKR